MVSINEWLRVTIGVALGVLLSALLGRWWWHAGAERQLLDGRVAGRQCRAGVWHAVQPFVAAMGGAGRKCPSVLVGVACAALVPDPDRGGAGRVVGSW